MIEVFSCIVGPLETNCYILCNSDTKECIIIDPGGDYMTIKTLIRKKELKPVAIFITHGHFDHIGASNEMRAAYAVKIYAPLGDKKFFQNAQYNMSTMFSADRYEMNADVYLNDGEVLDFLGVKIKCIHTPGHTPGGMCFYLEEENLLFAGDTLFNESCGRTDFIGGSSRDIVMSIKNKLFVLPEKTQVFPGHGPETTIGYELKYNFIAGM